MHTQAEPKNLIQHQKSMDTLIVFGSSHGCKACFEQLQHEINMRYSREDFYLILMLKTLPNPLMQFELKTKYSLFLFADSVYYDVSNTSLNLSDCNSGIFEQYQICSTPALAIKNGKGQTLFRFNEMFDGMHMKKSFKKTLKKISP